MFNCFRCLILGMYAINLVGEPISVFLIAKRGYVCIMTNMFFLLYISFSRLNTGCLISMSSGTTSIRKTTVVAISIKFISILVRYEQFVSSLIPFFKFLKYKCWANIANSIIFFFWIKLNCSLKIFLTQKMLLIFRRNNFYRE